MTSTVPHQALYRRWRAQTFGEIVGQEAVVETLRNAVRTGRVSHAILFVGPRGTGKTSLARILAKAVNCTNLQDGDACDRCPSCVAIREGTTLDLVEIDAASNRGIDAVRDLRERLPYPPGELRRKVYILDEAHQITKDAWNALLKSLEEPPDFVVFMFASTEPSGFPPAILSRLQRFDVRRLSVPEIEGKLARILAADGRAADPAAIHLIAKLAAGGMRDAESMLDQLLSAAPDRIDEEHVRELLGLADAEAVEELIDHLVAADGAAGVALLDAQEARGRDVRALLDQAVDAIRFELLGSVQDAGRTRHDPAALAAVGRRLAAIDPNRPGIGGLRFQLELAMFDGRGAVADAAKPGATSNRGSSDVAPTTTPEEILPTAESRTSAERVPSPPVQPASPTRRVSTDTHAAPPAQTAGVVQEPSAAEESSVAASPGTAPVGRTTARPTDPAPAPPASQAAPSEPAAQHAAGLEEILVAWPSIVAQLSTNPPTKPLIVACRPVAVDGSVVTLGFPEEQAFLKDAAERRRPAIEAGIASVIGRPVAVRCIVANVELPPVSPPSADAGFVLAEARRIFAEDLIDVDEIS